MARISFPLNDNRIVIQTTPPAVPAIACHFSSSISSSSEITFNAATTFIEVGALDKGILLKWGTDNASTTAFDEVIPANTVGWFYLPNDVTAANFIEQTTSATLTVIEK